MTVKRHPFAAPLAAALVAVAAPAAPLPLAGAEIAATHLVFEKPAKMKKIDAGLYLSFVDQGRKKDTLGRPRRVDCTVTTQGSRGELSATGRLDLRLEGEQRNSAAPWRSSAISADLDGSGEAAFEAPHLLTLVAEAQAAGAEVELIALDYAGGKGKKVTTLTIDCLREPAED